jgi:PAS domain S-box-containing protein
MFGFATLSTQAIVTQWSDALSTLTGIKIGEAIGCRLTDLIPSLHTKDLQAAIQGVLDTGTPHTFAHGTFLSADGFALPYIGQLHPLTQATSAGNILFILEGGDDQSPHNMMTPQQQRRYVQTMDQVNQAIIAGDLDQALHTIADQALLLLQCDDAALYVEVNDQCKIYTSSHDNLAVSGCDQSLLTHLRTQLKETGQPIQVTLPNPNAPAQDAQPLPQTILAVPLTGENVQWGVLCVKRNAAHQFPTTTTALLQSLATAAMSAVTSIFIRSADKQRLEKLDALYQVSQSMRQMNTQDETIRQVLEQSATVMEATHGIVVWPAGVPGKLKVTAAYHLPDEILGVVVDEAKSVSGQVYRTGQPYLTMCSQEDPLCHPAMVRVLERVIKYRQSWLYAPIVSDKRVLGVLALGAGPGRVFTQVDAKLLSTIMEIAGSTLQNASLYEKTVQLSQQRKVLLKLATELSHAEGEPALYRIVLDNTHMALGVKAATLLILSEDQQTGKVVANYFSEPWRFIRNADQAIPINEIPLIRRVLSQHIPTAVYPLTDTTLLPQTRYYLAERSVKAGLLAPLIVNGQPIGLLAAYDQDQERLFSQVDLNMMQGIADQVAIALQRAQFYERLRHYAEELEERVKARTADLQVERDRTQAILDAAGEGIVMRDLEGHFLYVNARAKQITDLIQTNRANLDPDFWGKREDLTRTEQQTLQNIPLNARKTQELCLQKPDGSSLHIALTMTPVPGPEGVPVGVVGVFQDVTRLKELDHMKSVFVSNVSHELRTPITSLKLYLELLPKAGPEKAARYLDTLRRETQRLETMVEDLLVISRLDMGTTRAKIQPVNIGKLSAQVVEDRRVIAEQKNLSLSFQCAPQVPPVAGDDHFIVQIITNLLSNAINYTPSGGHIQVYITHHPEEKTHPVSLSIKDDGPGILAEDLPHLFERFYRGSAGLQSQAPGTGLGLAIVKELVDRLGGVITIDSIAGRGAIITVKFPVDLPTANRYQR